MNRKIAIICALDGLSNSVRPFRIRDFLRKHSYNVRLINVREPYFLAQELYQQKRRGRDKTKKEHLARYYDRFPLIKNMEARAEALLFFLKQDDYRTVICEDMFCSYLFLKGINSLTILDCPTPQSAELENGHRLGKKNEADYKFYSRFSPAYLEEFRKIELRIYKSVDYLTFWWQSYVEYVRKYVYRGKNIFVMNSGCLPKRKRAKYSSRPKIVFMGHLGIYWTNKHLLSLLTRKSPYPIDCYGIPESEQHYDLDYKGYLENLDKLNEYNFGLVTITRDRLRRWGFSAKTLDYLSYGLPVLMPRWRKEIVPLEGLIHYNEDSFIEQLNLYTSRREWNRKSEEAYEYAQKHTWDRELQPLLNILCKS